MEMKDYLKEIEFAVTKILQAVWYEHAELDSLNTEIAQLSAKQLAELPGISSFATCATNYVRVTGIPQNLENYSDSDREIFQKAKEVNVLKGKILVRGFAVAALSGSLLQFAKQGISIVHGGPKKCPDGRFIGRQAMKTIIWEGRNQSLHWEEKPLRRAIVNCFRQLCRDFGLTFGNFGGTNLGFEIVQLLEWKTFDDFRADMLLLH